MAKKRVFRQVVGQKAYRKWSLWEEGDWIEGIYVRKDIDFKYKKNVYLIELLDCGLADQEVEDNFRRMKNVQINSNGLIEKAFEGIEVGQVVRIDYHGTSEITKGEHAGEQAHSVTVSVASWEEDTGLVSDEGTDDL